MLGVCLKTRRAWDSQNIIRDVSGSVCFDDELSVFRAEGWEGREWVGGWHFIICSDRKVHAADRFALGVACQWRRVSRSRQDQQQLSWDLLRQQSFMGWGEQTNRDSGWGKTGGCTCRLSL